MLLIRTCKPVKTRYEKLTNRHGKGKALGILSHKLGRALYYMNKRQVLQYGSVSCNLNLGRPLSQTYNWDTLYKNLILEHSLPEDESL